MTEKTYDVIVLGGGTAGTQAAKTAAAAGRRTVMFNRGELGGLCILRGCMPTKTILHAAHLVHEAAHHRTPGVGRAELAIDFDAVMANKAAKVERFKRAKIKGIESGGYEVVDALARFSGPDTVVADGVTYRFTSGAVIATGSTVHYPPIPGLAAAPVLTSDDVLALRERPASAIVLGVGAIGLELAQFLARMGTEVRLVGRRRPFEGVDPAFADEMAAVFADEPRLALIAPAPPLAVRAVNDEVEVDVARGDGTTTLRAQRLVLATGRRANLDDLGLDLAGVAVRDDAVVAGADMRTTNPRVFVAGDATGDRLLLHVANWEGRVAGLGAAQVPGEHRVEQRLHMEVVFTDPCFATVGLSERAARDAGLAVITAAARLPETGRAITQDVAHGLFKLVAAPNGELLGAQILGPRADDLIHTIATAMYYRATAQDLLEMPWYHPTLSEVVLSLARDLDAQSGPPASTRPR